MYKKGTKCNLQDIEAEYHFILKCPYYNDIRTQYIKSYFFTRPNVYKNIVVVVLENI